MTRPINPAEIAGPNGDGSKNLAKESKVGAAVSSLVTVLALGVVEWLGTIDFSTLPTFFATVAALAAGQVAGLISAWATRNRRTRAVV